MPDGSYDVVVIGAGLAGTCAAYALSKDHKVLLIDGKYPAAEASGVAAGLVNPLMARKANPVWRYEEALDAFTTLLAETGTVSLRASHGVLRPALDEKQAGFFQETAIRHPEHGLWLSPETVAGQYPDVAPPFGALLVRTGTAIQVPTFLEAVLHAARANGLETQFGTSMTDWEETPRSVGVNLADGQHYITKHLILALGNGYLAHPALATLNLHRIKGQTLRVRRPPGLHPMPALSAKAYVVPDGDTLLLGSTYEHSFDHLRPTPEGTARILRQAGAVVPALAEAEVLETRAGVRVTVPGTRLPMLGPVPGQKHTWIFTGLGAKGLLMTPLLAQDLPRFLNSPDEIPLVIQPRKKG